MYAEADLSATRLTAANFSHRQFACGLTAELSGRPRCLFRTGAHNFLRAPGAATMVPGPLERVVSPHAFPPWPRSLALDWRMKKPESCPDVSAYFGTRPRLGTDNA